MSKSAVVASVAGIAVSAIMGVAVGILSIHAPAYTPQRQIPDQSPAAATQQLDVPSTTTDPTTTTEDVPVTTSEKPPASNVTIITDDPKHPITVISGPPAVIQPDGQPWHQMPTDPAGPTTTDNTPTPVITPQMPPGYPGSPTTENAPTN